eukprot:27548-Eustigmatos_ZCMA.PRE.1
MGRSCANHITRCTGGERDVPIGRYAPCFLSRLTFMHSGCATLTGRYKSLRRGRVSRGGPRLFIFAVSYPTRIVAEPFT